MGEPNEDSVLAREVRGIAPGDATVWRDRFGQLRLKLTDGREFRDVHLTLAFPLSQSQRMVIFRDADLAEIGIIDEYSNLDDQSREVVQEELEKAYFMPRIQRILSVREQRTIVTFEVETDRGYRTFQLPHGGFGHHHRGGGHSGQQLRVLPGGRILVQDVDANRYDIPSLADLDDQSQALLDEFL